MKEHLKTAYTEVNNYIDTETGEILESDIKELQYIAGTKDEFFLLFSSIVGVMKHFSMPQTRVFACLLKYADGVLFQTGKPWREQAAKETDLNERTIYNTLKELEAMNLIYKSDGLYMLNPKYAFKGSTHNRKGALQAIVKLGCKDCI